MFNKDFFPTPTEVICRMLFNEEIQGKVILEPSAGKGNIVDYLQKNGAKEVIACELNDDLAKIVQSKCRLLANDFLRVEASEVSHIDLIVMNPPFSNDESHILHAWDIAPAGCTVISLCNANTVERGRTRKQEQIQELINLHGRKESFANCFDDAERKTNVEIACVWLYKPKSNTDDEFEGYFSLDEEMEEQGEGLVKYNYVRDLVGRYTDAVRLFDSVMEVANKVNDITAPISKHGIKFGAFDTGERNYADRMVTRDEYKKSLQKQCWMKIFNDMKMDKYVTKGVKETINKFVEQQVHVPFTMKNIYKMVELIVGTHGNRMGNVLVEAFDLICSYSAENSTAGEKWRTNSDYMVNKKFIVPYICEYDARWATDYVKLRYGSNRDRLEDINKALCFLTATNFDSIPPIWRFVENTTNVKDTDNNRYKSNQAKGCIPMLWGQWYEWGFFRIRGYKKGTMHFEFIDEKVWMQFNTEVAKTKGWSLPKTSSSTKKARKKGTGVEMYG